MPSRSLLVALHDVTPAHETRVRRIVDLLCDAGVNRFALFVVPDWHGAWPLDEYPAFVDWLGEMERLGGEIFLHGYRHDEVGWRRTPTQWARAIGRTAREAEFLVLPIPEAERRIDRGLVLLESAGLTAIGFVPPAWLGSRGLAEVVRRKGLTVTEDAWAVRDLAVGTRVRAPAVRWSTRTPWRARAGVIIAARRAPFERRRRLLRLAIHPPDIDHPAVAGSLRRTLTALVKRRTPVSYRAVFRQ